MKEKFVSDIDIQNQNYACIIRSTIQHGKLKKINVPPLPKEYFIFTAQDIIGKNALEIMGTSIPLFASDTISYYGEPLGIIVGPDSTLVQDICSKITIECEHLDPIEFPEAFPETFLESQILYKRIIKNNNQEKKSKKKKSKQFETNFTINKQDYYYGEPLGAVAHISKNMLEVYTATQWPLHVQKTVSAATNYKEQNIKIIPTALGEPLGGKLWYPSLLSAYVAVASILCKKPVKLLLSKHENFLFSNKSTPATVRYQTSLFDNGTIKEMHIRIVLNAGAYSPLIQEIVERIAITATGYYSVPAYTIEIYALHTNNPPLDVFFDWGESNSFLALENHISQLIAHHGYSPIDWRLQNIAENHSMNENIQNSLSKDTIKELFLHINQASDFSRKYSAYNLLAKNRNNLFDGPIKGIALAFGYQANSFIHPLSKKNKYSVEMTMNIDSHITIKTEFQSKRIQSVLKDIVSSLLAIDSKNIGFEQPDYLTIERPGPESLSTNICILAPLIEKCCNSIQKQRFREALPITVKREQRIPRKMPWDTITFAGKPFISITPAVCVVELEINPINYEQNIKAIWIASNPGKIYNMHAAKSSLETQIPTAISKAYGQAIHTKKGKLIVKDTIHFSLMHPHALPKAHIHFLKSDDVPRGIETIPINLIPAAITSALTMVSHTPVENIPLKPHDIYKILELDQ